MTKSLAEKGIGPALAAVLPQDGIPWYKKPYLLKLNICLFSLFLFSSANGYDGSLMNGLQALPQWQDSLNHPKCVTSDATFTRLSLHQWKRSLARIYQRRAISWSFLLLPGGRLVK
jgi:hypothetical protein